MIRTTTKINNIHCVIYTATVPTTNWVIFLHGKGEWGSPNGSQLDLVDKNGYTAKAKTGFEFPFNIIAPQIHTNMDFWQLTGSPGTDSEGWFVNHVKETLGASEIIVTGLSLGGRGSWNLLRYDAKKYIKAIAPVCGYYNITEGPICSLRSVPGYSWHHQSDMVMIYKYDADNVGFYNGCPNNSGKTQLIDGTTRQLHYLLTLSTPNVDPHADAWLKAYDVTVGKDSLLKWIVQNFAPVVVPVKDEIVSSYYLDGKIYHNLQSGKTACNAAVLI